jgi:hypothetical protein
MKQQHPTYEDADCYDYAVRRECAAVEADVWVDHAIVHLSGSQQAVIEGNGVEFNYDYEPQSIVGQINRAMAHDGIHDAVCWRFRWMGGEVAKWINIENESARLHAESALWDEDKYQLVAALFAASDIQLSKAVMAGLMTNSDKVGKTWLREVYGRRVNLASAKGRYVRVSRSLAESNAAGNALAVLHPKAGNPREFAGAFYVVAAQGEDLRQKFQQRLDMALELPVKAKWANYLLTAGEDAGLVANLSSFGAAFSGLRVSRKAYGENSWESVISAGLRDDAISI